VTDRLNHRRDTIGTMAADVDIPRVALKQVTPEVSAAMRNLHVAAVSAAQDAGVEPALLELVRIRASQINGCAFCIDMHTKDARAAGETEERIYALNAWRETPFYTERERAALALTEAVTLVHDGHVPDDVYRAAAEVFKEAELAALVWAGVVINAYNRVAVSTRMEPGKYRPAAR
jgi:AhpD family alkylhydroperoxidase